MKYKFTDPKLLDVALTHTSWAYENDGAHNERLEFLGDAVLQMYCTEMLYHAFPDDREGVLHGYRTQLVSTTHLAAIALRWGLDEQAKLGKGEESTGGRKKDRLLAGLFEAVLGAIYLDGGYSKAKAVINDTLAEDLVLIAGKQDARIVLHEWVQKQDGAPPEYSVAREEGPPHSRVFTIQVKNQGGVIAEGQGRSKKSAGVAAAEAAVKVLGLDP